MSVNSEMTEVLGIVAAKTAASGIRVFGYYPDHWKQEVSERLAVKVAKVTGTAGPEGGAGESLDFVAVNADLAGDLARGAEVVITADRGDERGIMAYRVTVLGLIEHDAEQAFAAVREAIEQP